MKFLVEVVEVDEVLGVDMDVVVVVTTVTLPMMRTHSQALELLLVKVPSKERLGSPLKGVVMVDLVVLSVGVVVVALAMEMVVKRTVHGEFMTAVAGLDTGECYYCNIVNVTHVYYYF